MFIKETLSTNVRHLAAAGLILVLAIGSIHCEPQPDADNVCTRKDTIKKDIVTDEPIMYEIKVQSVCGLVPCVKTRFESRMDQKIKTILQQVERRVCCSGYTETPDGRCAPICSESCQNGAQCVAFNTCECQPKPTDSTPGFVGSTCDYFVCSEAGKWGPQCDRPCNCPENSHCSADTGNCLCRPGGSWSANCSATLVTERQKAEALVLDDDVKIVADEAHDWNRLTTSYLVGLLSVVCLVFIVAFFVIKRKYDRIRSELCYSASTYASSNYSEPSAYDSAGIPIPGADVVPSNGKLAKNFSFAVTTRNILRGKDVTFGGDKSGHRNLVMLHPRVESHLIHSQKQSEQNFYTELGSSKQTPATKPLSRPAASAIYSPSEDHIYQVPRSTTPSVCARSQHQRLPNSPEELEESSEPSYSTSSCTMDQSLEDDSTSNIYEELKPRT